MKRVCVITGTRADYGLLRPLMCEIARADDLELQVIATGTHLSDRFGMTVSQVESDGFTVNERVPLPLDDDSTEGVAHATGFALTGLARALGRLRPDLAIILGDRFEALAAATAACLMLIPIAHIQGGEITEGAVDDSLRHAITKLSSLHFTSAEPYRTRVIQLGEDPNRIKTVGSLGLDNVLGLDLLDEESLASQLGVQFGTINILVTFHPVTLAADSLKQAQELLEALERTEANVLFTHPNADAGNRSISEMFDRWAGTHSDRSAVFTSLGTLRYLSLMKLADVVLGNSSSGIFEAPALGTPTVNIGLRQQGRLKPASVIDCPPDAMAIASALRIALSERFRQTAFDGENMYGDGHAAQRIVEAIRSVDLASIRGAKRFFDLNRRCGDQ